MRTTAMYVTLWNTALHHGCPMAWLCISFFYRHDQMPLSQARRNVTFLSAQLEPGETEWPMSR
jgi:hypothetical protein